MLIRGAEIYGRGLADLRLAQGRVTEIGTLTPSPGEEVIDAGGGALLPGLHDHHIHLPALAARRSSVFCGPPEVMDADALAIRIGVPGNGWLRGIGYHESVAGMLDRTMLDRMAPHRPIRIQHRSGRMWFFNSAGLDAVLSAAPPPSGLNRDTGQLFDEDRWLRETLGGSPPDLGPVSAELARMGITGITDMSPANDPVMAAHFRAQQACGALRQRCLMAGTLALAQEGETDRFHVGPAKLHLHEADLPDYDGAVAFIAAAHEQDRVVAIHCVSETELVFALSALEDAGLRTGDRIEHASVAPDHLVAEIARLNLIVVSQPNFIAERGDEYRVAVEPDSVPFLYRLQAFRQAGVIVAGGSDAPFGEPDPWAAMQAAVSRRTRTGHVMGADEALSPDEALSLYLADPVHPGRQRQIAMGEAADICLLDKPWRQARERLVAEDVRAVFVDGTLIGGAG